MSTRPGCELSVGYGGGGGDGLVGGRGGEGDVMCHPLLDERAASRISSGVFQRVICDGSARGLMNTTQLS